MFWQRIFIICATSVALFVAITVCLKSRTVYTTDSITQDSSNKFSSINDVLEKYLSTDKIDLPESCYPFVWQKRQRERLRTLLQILSSRPPVMMNWRWRGMCNIRSNMRTSRYSAKACAGSRIMRSTIICWLIWYVRQGVSEKPPKTRKQVDAEQHEYTILDRQKLDQGMRELALGLALPFQTHHGALLRAQLTAMPPSRYYVDRIKEIAVMSALLYPEYAKMRNLARVNSFYLSLLLSEGKRTEAEPFLYTGEHLVVQVANAPPLSLIGQLVALAVGAISERDDARVCRSFGLTREAAMIEAHQKLLLGKVRTWRDHRKERAKELDALVSAHAGLLANIFLPMSDPAHLLTRESLCPSILVEYVKAEGAQAAGLCILAFLLMVYAGLTYWRWRLAMRGAALPAPTIHLSPREWVGIVGCGLLAPLAFYLLFIATPQLSGRDAGVVRAGVPFMLGIYFITLSTFLVPPIMVFHFLHRRMIAAGLQVADDLWRSRFSRLVIVIYGIIWCFLAFFLLLAPIGLALLTPVLAHTPVNSGKLIVQIFGAGVLLLGLPLLPAVRPGKDTVSAPRHLAIARTMIALFAVMTLFFAALIPICDAFERYYVRADRVIAPMTQGDDISITMVEGRLVIMLRQDVRDGATVLGIPWQ